MAGEGARPWKQADRVDAVAVGAPGQREFQLRVSSANDRIQLTVEKEQLQVLAMLVEQLLTGLPAVQVRNPEFDDTPGPQPPGDFPTDPEVSFRVARLSLGIDQER